MPGKKHKPEEMIGKLREVEIVLGRGGTAVEARTREVVDGCNIEIMGHFRKLDTLADAFVRHGELPANARPYANARAPLPDPDRFADALTDVYATDPNYGTLLRHIMRGANLYRYN